MQSHISRSRGRQPKIWLHSFHQNRTTTVPTLLWYVKCGQLLKSKTAHGKKKGLLEAACFNCPGFVCVGMVQVYPPIHPSSIGLSFPVLDLKDELVPEKQNIWKGREGKLTLIRSNCCSSLIFLLGTDEIVPQVLEMNFGPDCERACRYHPNFFNFIFSLLFLGDANGWPVERIT